jgi:hypothetical protein
MWSVFSCHRMGPVAGCYARVIESLGTRNSVNLRARWATVKFIWMNLFLRILCNRHVLCIEIFTAARTSNVFCFTHLFPTYAYTYSHMSFRNLSAVSWSGRLSRPLSAAIQYTILIITIRFQTPSSPTIVYPQNDLFVSCWEMSS